MDMSILTVSHIKMGLPPPSIRFKKKKGRSNISIVPANKSNACNDQIAVIIFNFPSIVVVVMKIFAKNHTSRCEIWKKMVINRRYIPSENGKLLQSRESQHKPDMNISEQSYLSSIFISTIIHHQAIPNFIRTFTNCIINTSSTFMIKLFAIYIYHTVFTYYSECQKKLACIFIKIKRKKFK